MTAAKKKPGRPASTESKDRVIIGEELMKRLQKMADDYNSKHGMRPTIPQLISMLAAKAVL